MANPLAGLDNLIGKLGKESGSIRAYHGSPYDWDRVDMSMVGKGEGPLLEGFGLYGTADPSAANWYRHRTAKTRRSLLAREMQDARAAGNADLLAQAQELASRLQRATARENIRTGT